MNRNIRRIIALALSTSIGLSYLNISKVEATTNLYETKKYEKNVINVEKVAEFATGSSSEDGGAAEIVKYNKDNNKFYVVDGVNSKLHIVSLDGIKSSVGSELQKEKSIDLKEIVEKDGFFYGDLTSVAISTKNKEIAVAIQASDYAAKGKIVILDYDGNFKDIYDAGVQPDMVTYTKDSNYILAANEGEPRMGYGDGIVDPEGSVTLVNLNEKTSKNIGFEGISLEGDVILRKGDKVNKNNPKYDLEPEYITIDEESNKAYVSLQENNAIAVIDIKSGSLEKVKALGFKDFSEEGNSLDAAANGVIELENLPIKGAYMPDSISYHNGYIITANEGDGTEFGNYSNVTKLSKIKDKLKLDYKNFKGYSSQEELDIAVDKIKNTKKYDKLEVLDEIGNDAIYVQGGRSFSIWNANTLDLVYDSGNKFEEITAEAYPDYFNTTNSKIEMDGRSTKKGPEPEEVRVGEVDGKPYVFVGLERIGGVMTYDISNVSSPKFMNYTNTRDFSKDIAGDVAPESIDFISAKESSTGYPLLVVANEVSGTVSVLEIKEGFEKELKIFHTNDVHSRVDSYAKIKEYIDEDENRNKLLVDAGDTFHGQSFATLERGSSIAKILKEMGYSAMVPGNHDFNYGQDRLKVLGSEANIEILASNVKKNNKEAYGSNKIIEINGVKVGLFGISTPETAYKTNPKNVEGLDFGDLNSIFSTSKDQVKKLKDDGADIIIALTHLGIDEASEIKSTDIAKNVEGIDLVIDGHSHSILSKYDDFNSKNNIKITSTGEYLNNLGEVTISLDENNNVENIELNNIDTKTLVNEDKEIKDLVKTIKDNQAPILNTVVGATPIQLDGAREKVRYGHTNLGRLITSAMLSETGADIAITNGGGIRDSIKEGDITKGDVIKVLPFGNYIITKKVKGSDIIKALNHGMVVGAGSFTHFAGINVEYSSYKNEKGAEAYKVEKATINGKQIDVNKEYVLATNDFMAVGGDGYTMFKDYPTLNEYSALDEALINYISKVGAEGIKAVSNENRLIKYKIEDNNSGNNSGNTGNNGNQGGNSGSNNQGNSNGNSNNTSTDNNISNQDKNLAGSLPNTGGTDTDLLLLFATLLTSAGTYIIIKKKHENA